MSRGAPILPLAPAAQDGYAVNIDYAVSVMCDASAYARRNADSAGQFSGDRPASGMKGIHF